MNYTKKSFDYSKKKWGVTPITNLKTDFQGQELTHFLEDTAPKLSHKATIVDVGCGGGNILSFLKERNPKWNTVGIDISPEVLSIAKKRFPQVNFKRASGGKLPIKKNSVDCVLFMDSLEHIENPQKALEEAFRILKHNGVLFVSIPLEKQFPSLYWLLYILGWRGKARHSGHVNFYNDKEFIQFVRSHGFELIKRRFSYHFVFSVFDIGYYFLESVFGGKSISFESNVNEMEDSVSKRFLLNFKKFVSNISYFESGFLHNFPGGKGHYTFIKQDKPDFFSHNPPFTFFEEYQTQVGLLKVIRPKDLAIKRHLNRLGFKSARTILDFGCANGLWLERILTGTKKKGVGVDIAEELINEANKRKGRRGIYINTMNKWPIKNKSVDIAVSFDVFEHITAKQAEIEVKRIYDSLVPGGKFLFYTLNPRHKFTFDWAFEKLGSDYLYKRADHNIKLFPDPKKFKNSLEKQGFKNVDFQLFDGPANLIWDVGCYAYLAIIGYLLKSLGLSGMIHSIIILNDLAVRIVYPINNIIDKVFLRTKNSNGYFIWGEK